jgi:hypothetical protein
MDIDYINNEKEWLSLEDCAKRWSTKGMVTCEDLLQLCSEGRLTTHYMERCDSE